MKGIKGMKTLKLKDFDYPNRFCLVFEVIPCIPFIPVKLYFSFDSIFHRNRQFITMFFK
jgi:hypothetical protein